MAALLSCIVHFFPLPSDICITIILLIISLLINIKTVVIWVSLSPSQGSLETETTLRLLMKEPSLEVCLQGNGRGNWQFGKDINSEIGIVSFEISDSSL